MTPDQGDTPRTPPERQPQQPPAGGQGQPPRGAETGQGPPQQGPPQGPPPGAPPQQPSSQQPPAQPTQQPGFGAQQPPLGPQQQGPRQGGPQVPGQQSGPQDAGQFQGQGMGTPAQSPMQQPPGVATQPQGPTVQPGAPGAAPAGRRYLEPTSVDDVVQTDVYTAELDTPISEIVEDMRELQVGSAVVVEDDTPIGIVTDRAIALALADNPDIAEETAEELVQDEVVSAMEGTDVFEVLDTMSEEGIRRVPVVDEEGRLEGIVALDDILLLLQSKLDTVAETIRSQFPRL